MAKKTSIFLLVFLFHLFAFNFKAYAVDYYASGDYLSIAPVKPVTGLYFYVDQSAYVTYGASVFTSAFEWNSSNHVAGVSSVVMYPAPQSSYSNYFLITTSNTIGQYNFANTVYYDLFGNEITSSEPFNSTGIFKVRIEMNANTSVYSNTSNVPFSVAASKTLKHEVGHVFLLKHPSNIWSVTSIMHQGIPNSSTISSTVTSSDHSNIGYKWGV